jgi:hypothetical protein
MSFLINPFTFAVAGGDFESIATVTVGSGGAASAEFTSIPSTYQHLQLRYIAKNSATSSNLYLYLQFNGDSTSETYANHWLRGNGASATAGAATGQNVSLYNPSAEVPGNTTASLFGVGVIDILDYASTTKNTTVRKFSGQDSNGSGDVIITSGLWPNTAAISSILVKLGGQNLAQHSQVALYGVKAP